MKKNAIFFCNAETSERITKAALLHRTSPRALLQKSAPEKSSPVVVRACEWFPAKPDSTTKPHFRRAEVPAYPFFALTHSHKEKSPLSTDNSEVVYSSLVLSP